MSFLQGSIYAVIQMGFQMGLIFKLGRFIRVHIHIFQVNNMAKHPARADPLDQLRKAFNKKLERRVSVKLKGTDLFFDKERFSLKTQTAWQSTQTQKQFTLGSLWLFLKFHTALVVMKAEYTQQAYDLNLERINIADQKEIIDYFTGEVDETTCIKNELKIALSQKNQKRDQPAGGFQQADDQPSKKVKTEQQTLSHELQVMEYLLNFERPVNSKSKCLRYPNKSFYGIIKDLVQCQNKSIEESKQASKVRLMPRIARFVQKKRLPIIIVPASFQAENIYIQNIQKFLTKGEYDEKIRLDNPLASKVQIQKEMKGKRIIFQANSRPNLLSINDWEYVVAVFVQGKEGEFEGWPETDHRKIFSKGCGFFIRTPGPLNNASREWRVKSFIVERKKVNTDKEIVNTIWTDIENYIFKKI